MATKTHERADFRALRRMLDNIRRDDDGTRGLFVQAMGNFLTAAGYQDEVLVRSALAEAKTELGDLLVEAVENLVKRSSASQALIRQVTTKLEGVPIEPDEQFDELGRSLSSVVSTALRALCDFRDGEVATSRKHGVEVPNAAKLDEHIAHWQAVKRDLVDLWPWSTIPLPLPPVDREMVARSRAAYQASERGEDINALIERLRSN